MIRWARRGAALVLVALGVLGVVRGVDLMRNGWRPAAPGEIRWWSWAGGLPEERALLPERWWVQVRGAAAGRPLWLVAPEDPARTFWLKVMIQYALPAHPVAGVVAGDDTEGPPAGATAVNLTAPPTGLLPAVAPSRWRRGLSLALGLLAVSAVGAVLLRHAVGGLRGRDLVPAAVLGVTLLAPLLGVLSASGILLSPGVVLTAALGLMVVGWWLAGAMRPRHCSPPPARLPGPPAAWRRVLTGAIPAGLVTVAAAKLATAPIWSWDHFAIWGLKARRLALVPLGPELLDPGPPGAFGTAAAGYPLGLPLGWLVLALGEMPSGGLFRAAHLLAAIALVTLVGRAARELAAAPVVAAAAAAAIAASPLLWDTEHLGLADLPLALWSVAALVLALDLRLRARGAGWPAGLVLGFLPWIKQEGWPLLFLLAPALLALGRPEGPARRRWGGQLVASAALLATGSPLLLSRVEGVSVSFFTGDATGRFVARLGELPRLLGLLSEELLGRAWLGLWPLGLAALGAALALRRWRALWLGSVVAGQLAVYAGVYLATYLDPAQHIASSFARIAAALLPLAVLTTAALFEEREGCREGCPQEISSLSGSASEPSSPLRNPDFLA
jgi:hypothetical protein